MFHGPSPSHAHMLLNTGFSLDFVASGSMFGHGLYFDESSLIADGKTTADVGGPYDGLSAMVVCRATVGRTFVTAKPGVHDQMVKGGAYDSVCGQQERPNGDTYREFVFFHEGSVYPEFVFFYRRTGESGRKASEPACTTPTSAMSPAQEIMAA
uniref:Poly [ADP-ribose] polymerase n=1 Tax=Noctiluca scintillans TaxID=2966 RepID=A0A7S0ZUK0_NOCSC